MRNECPNCHEVLQPLSSGIVHYCPARCRLPGCRIPLGPNNRNGSCGNHDCDRPANRLRSQEDVWAFACEIECERAEDADPGDFERWEAEIAEGRRVRGYVNARVD